MNTVRVGIAIVLLGSIFCGCAPSETPAQQQVDREVTALAPLQANSLAVVTGMDVKNDTTLVVSIDLNQWTTVDDTDNAALEAAALKRWKTVWPHEHPGAHALLHIIFADFHGKSIYTESEKV